MEAVASKEEYISEIKRLLSSVDPYKIVLFGSYASNIQNSESDIDILVILDEESLPKTYEERMNKRLSVRRALRELNKKIPIDSITYTRKEYEIISNNKNSFFKDIELHGITIYEKAS